MRPALLVPVLAAVSLLLPPAAAGTPVWVETFAAEVGTRTEVDSSATGTVVAVVGGGTVVASKDSGMTWVPLGPLSSPPAGGSSQTVVAVSTGTRWFAENGSAVSTTPDAGTTWKEINVPRVVSPVRESFEFATDIGAAEGVPTAAVGWTGARIRGLCPYALDFTPLFVTRNGGASWRRTDLPAAGRVESVQWFDSRRAAVVVMELDWTDPQGDENECSSTGTVTRNSVWTTSDSGATWRRSMTTTEWFVAAAWATPSSVVVIGETDGVGRSYVSLDAGRTYRKPVPIYINPGVPGTRLNGFPAVEFVGDRRGWVGAIASGIYRTDSGGSEWVHEVSSADGAFYGVSDLTALDASHAVFGGPRAILARYGEVGAAAPGAPPLPPSVAGSSVTTTIGRVSSTVTWPAYGPMSVTLRVAP